jgi:hypothetical protein
MLDGLSTNIFLSEIGQPDGPILPSPWNAIYYEGVRANHILFEQDDIDHGFGQKQTCAEFSSPGFADEIERVAASLYAAQNLVEMRRIIAAEPQTIRHGIFRIYQNYLRRWQQFIKSYSD